MPISPPVFNSSTEGSSQGIRQIKETQDIKIGNEEVKLYVFTDNMILYTEILRNPLKWHLELINKFSKVTKYKNNIKDVFYILTMNVSKMKLRKQCHSQQHQSE